MLEKIELLELVEEISKENSFDEFHIRDKCETFLICFLQDEIDVINTYERRGYGITDEKWNEVKLQFRKLLNEID